MAEHSYIILTDSACDLKAETAAELEAQAEAEMEQNRKDR